MKTVETIRKAAETGDITKVEFFKDGSGATFYVRHEDTGRGTSTAYSVNIKEAIQAVAGFRFKQHEFKTCY